MRRHSVRVDDWEVGNVKKKAAWFIFACLLISAAVLMSCQSSPPSLTRLDYKCSWQASTRDVNDRLMAGTEIMYIVPYKGKLYAATDLWMESDPDIPKACQILVLDSPEGQWRVEHQFTTNNLRLVTLKVVTFTTDSEGNSISPVSILLAAPDVYLGDLEVFSLDDESGEWVPMALGEEVWEYSTTRAIGLHHDVVTGIDHIFAGTSTLGTISGVYDPDVPGRIRWEQSPEFQTPSGERVMGFCDCNGDFYCATSRYIYRRTDGPSPSWQEVYYCPEETSPAGIRGLSAVPNPSGSGEVLIFAALKKVHRLDPSRDFRETIELDMQSFLADLWDKPVAGVLAAYNRFMPYTIPQTGETVWLFGFESSYPRSYINADPPPEVRLFVREDLKWYFAAEARYFIRHANGEDISYEVAEVVDPGKPTLVAVRTIAVSPFPGDRGQVLYFGGFDCNSQPCSNTAWIYRGELRSK